MKAKPAELWIVDQDGENLQIVDGRDKYGRTYQLHDNKETIYGVIFDGDGVWVADEFAVHPTPFELKQ